LAVRIGLGYVKGVHREEMEALVAERERGGAYDGIAALASRSGAGMASLERLAWAGALDGIPAGAGSERREALWRVGVAANGRARRARTQLALPIEPPAPPPLQPLGGWGKLIADYRSTGIVLGEHPLELLRPGLDAAILRSVDLELVADGVTVEVAGMVVARQRPGTAKGIVFMLLEDEAGTINLVVPPEVYERHRTVVRSEPLIVAEGKLERHPAGGGQINVLVTSMRGLDGAERPAAEVKDFSMLDEAELARQRDGDFRAVAPAVQSFASGRRR